jgi:glycosyltransferase EpsD
MACGLPVIANDNRGHRELIENNKNGWLINNNPEDFSNKIKILASNNDMINKFGLEGRTIILNRFSINKVLEEKRYIYRKYTGDMEDVMWAIH